RAHRDVLDASGRGAAASAVAALAAGAVEVAARQQPELLAFPGPFARSLVRALDAAAMRPGRISRYAAISRVVARREGYFPSGVDVEVVYPPVASGGFDGGPPGDSFFCASRLDPPKRIDLVISAFRATRKCRRLVIAGTGPERARLQELRRLYAGCRAGVFVPYDEDFGYVALESQLAGKALVTCTDSGGAAELTQDGVTGLVVAPEAAALARAMDSLAGDAALAARMGEAGRQSAQAVTWPAAAERLLAPVTRRPRAAGGRRKRITVAVPFPVTPVVGGGRARVFEMYRHVAARADVELVCFDPAGASRRAEIAPGLSEVVIGASQEHRRREAELSEPLGWTPVSDVALPVLERFTPALREAVAGSAARADAVIASHPYVAPLLAGPAAGPPLFYEAHNVELSLKREVLGRFPGSGPLLELTALVERWCLQEAALTFACSEEDRAALAELHGRPPGPIVVAPNGVDPKAISFASPQERVARQRDLGLSRPRLVFMGSWHPPNLEAAEWVLEFARALPRAEFVLIGNLDGYFRSRGLPPNVSLAGFLDVPRKLELLHSADLALNPMKSGSGTNLKLIEYCAAGVPVISTAVGLRGLGELREVCAVSELERFPATIEERLKAPAPERGDVARARSIVEARFSWEQIAARAYESIERYL